MRRGGLVRRFGAACGAVALAATLAACQEASAGAPTPIPTPSSTPSEAVVSSAVLRVTPEDTADDVRLDVPVRVAVSHGRVTDVSVVATDGSALEGSVDDTGTTWTSSGRLAPGLVYSVTASAVDAVGLTTHASSLFSTLVPEETSDAGILPRDGWTVGVGMPVIVDFDSDVDNREAVERALVVETSSALEGAWRWFSDSQVQWRPRDFWPAGEQVSVTADLGAVEISPGVWGTDSGTASFDVGSAMVSTVDVANHTMTVRRDGAVLRTIPITTGKDGFDTRRGTKVIMTRESSHRMDAATTGIAQDDPEYYDLVVEYAMRLTWSGEFIHAAPWSVGSQGSANVSHGCTGMSTADARWLFERSKVGDVVEFVGSDRSLEWGNGYTAWNMSFEDWAAGSA